MIRTEIEFLCGIWLKELGEEGLWAEEKMVDLEEAYFDPFNLETLESFDDASKRKPKELFI